MVRSPRPTASAKAFALQLRPGWSIFTTLEKVTADRDTNVLAFRKSLEPMRAVLGAQPYLGGSVPAYADYVVFGCFQWARCISPFPLLFKDDPVWARRDRLLSAFDGLARKALAYAV